jgi:serine/threonine protein kinase
MSEFPRRFGAYLLLKPLARGGMGALYLALSGAEETAKLCVIKTVLPHLADKEYLQRFRDEAKVVVRLSHGNLVPVFDSGQADGEIYLAMDFVEGRDLRATWNRCAKKGIAFPIDVAAHIIKELARGLFYAHSFGSLQLVHRDVSPPNVLLSYTGEVKVTDFGLASSTLKMEKTAPGIIYGKVSYMSPEQARGEPLDGRTDLYAAGIILWELLTGRQLFPSGKVGAGGGANDAPTAEELLQRVRHPDIVPPSRRASRVPAELDRITTKALAPDLAQRYQTCEELRRDLATFLAQTSPATDGVRVAKFLSDLYGDEIDTERTEREALIESARRNLATTGTIVPRPFKGPPPAPMSTSPRPPPPPPMAGKQDNQAAKNGVERPKGSKSEERREKGTVVSGLLRPARPLEKRPAPAGAAGAAALAATATAAIQPSRDTQAVTGDTEAQSSAVVGSIVGGRYHIRRLCGEGGMGRVYEAEHIEIGKRVALKILHPAYSQTPDLVERLKREARAASKISHPNVVDVTDSGTTPEGAFFFVMEYIEGIELGELIFREKTLEVPRALAIAAQVCRALHAAHQVNVIHRDLKPENVLILSRDGQRDFIKVLDFGIAKSGDTEVEGGRDSQGRPWRRLTQPGMTMGTPEYMAPEQATGHPADPRSDVYAVGGILYEMLSGKPPYEGTNFMEILNKKANQLPAPLATVRADVPAEVEALVVRALSKSPAARPQTMEDLERELQHLASVWYPAPPRTEQELARVVSMGRLPVVRGASPVTTEPVVGEALLARLRAWDRRKVAMVAGGLLAVLVGAVALGSAAHKKETRSGAGAAAGVDGAKSPALGVGPATPPGAPPTTTAPPASPTSPTSPTSPLSVPGPGNDSTVVANTDNGTDNPGKPGTEPDGDTLPRPGSGVGHAGKGSWAPPADNHKLMEEALRLMRGQQFPDARKIFIRLTKSRLYRGQALLGLAEISFQEKDYEQAVQFAARASERGGGVRARVLLGDAHFRLSQFKEAAKAYDDALKLDPSNAIARSGLTLANKRM